MTMLAHRLLRFTIAAAAMFSVNAYAWQQAPLPHAPPLAVDQQEMNDVTLRYPMPAFNGVQSEGNLDIELRTSGTSEVLVIGPRRYVDRIIPVVSDKKFISVSLDGQKPLPRNTVRIIICGPHIKRIRQEGSGNITGNNLNVPSLHIESRGRGNVTLNDINADALSIASMSSGTITVSGVLNVEEIVQTGPGSINLYWVESDLLRINAAGTGIITLAGVANNVQAVLYNGAMLDSKYLRTERSYINALDYSSAHISPIETLNAFATNHGSIYYYKDPKHLAQYSADVGGVMRMVGINDITFNPFSDM
jgi:hypothetical protein